MLNVGNFNCPVCGKPFKKMVRVFLWCDASIFPERKVDFLDDKIKLSKIDEPEPEQWLCPEHGTFKKLFCEAIDTGAETE